jgi:hypothetical protein
LFIGTFNGSTGSFPSGTVGCSMLHEVTQEYFKIMWCSAMHYTALQRNVAPQCLISQFLSVLYFCLLHHPHYIPPALSSLSLSILSHSTLSFLFTSFRATLLLLPYPLLSPLPSSSAHLSYLFSTRTLISLDGAADLLRPYLAEIVAEYFRIMEEVENDAVLSALQVCTDIDADAVRACVA